MTIEIILFISVLLYEKRPCFIEARPDFCSPKRNTPVTSLRKRGATTNFRC